MKLRLKNVDPRGNPFSIDVENSFGEMIRCSIPPGETVVIDDIDPFYINQDKEHLRETIFRDGYIEYEFVCEPDDMVCFTGFANFGDTRPAGKGQILVGDGTVWQKFGPGPDGDVLEWDAAQPLGVKFGTGGGAGTVVIEDEGTSIGAKSIIDFVGPGVTATNVGSGRARVSIPGGGGVLPTPTQVGQFLYSTDGATFAPKLPVVTTDGEIVVTTEGRVVVT